MAETGMYTSDQVSRLRSFKDKRSSLSEPSHFPKKLSHKFNVFSLRPEVVDLS